MGIKAVIFGFGTVGQGIYEVIHSHQKAIERNIGKPVEIVGILVRNGSKKRNIQKGILVTTDIDELLNLPKVKIVFEAIVGKEPCFTYLKKAIDKGCHVVTANKYMFAHYGGELLELAEQKGVSFRYEATVAGGVPVIGSLEKLIRTNEIKEFQGIVNGTCNYILTEMRTKRISFHHALKNAQDLGYAEANPDADIEGFDAFYKFIILLRSITGLEPPWKEIICEGITDITLSQIQFVENLNLRFKHVIYFSQNQETGDYWIKPVLVDSSHPFYQVEGVNNSIEVTGSIVGSVTFTGPGAGKLPTASAMVEDVVQIYQHASIPSKKSSVKTWSLKKSINRSKNWIGFCGEELNSFIETELSIINKWSLDDQLVFLFSSTAEQVQSFQEKYGLKAYEILTPSAAVNHHLERVRRLSVTKS